MKSISSVVLAFVGFAQDGVLLAAIGWGGDETQGLLLTSTESGLDPAPECADSAEFNRLKLHDWNVSDLKAPTA